MWAPVYDSTVTFLEGASGSLAIGHLAEPRLEPEVALHCRSAPPATTDEAELLSHVDWVAHGYEIAQSQFPGWTFRAADAIAGFGLHGPLVVGPRRQVAELPNLVAQLRTFTVDVARNGVVQPRGGGANVLDSPLLAATELLAVLTRQPHFDPIQAREIVTTGTLTPLPGYSRRRDLEHRALGDRARRAPGPVPVTRWVRVRARAALRSKACSAGAVKGYRSIKIPRDVSASATALHTGAAAQCRDSPLASSSG
jgi:hypothetical protein